MAYCRFCGKELVNGACSCAEFQASAAKAAAARQTQEQQTRYQQDQYQQNRNQQNQYQQNQYQQDQYRQDQYQQTRYQQDQYQQTQYQQNQNGQEQHQQNRYEEEPAMQDQGEGKDPFLIQSFNPDFSSFSSLVTSMRDMMGRGEADSMYEDPYERDIPIVPDCIEPEENEIVVKQYNIAKLRSRMKFTRAEGRLMVTNRRLLFRATGTSPSGNVIQEHQFNLDEIGGLEMHKDYKFSILNLVGAILLLFGVLALVIMGISNVESLGAYRTWGYLLGFAGLVPSIIVYKRPWFKLLGVYFSLGGFILLYLLARIQRSESSKAFIVLLVLVCILLVLDIIMVLFVPNLVIRIKTTGALPAVTLGSQKSIFQRQVGDDYSGFKEVLPWEDSMLAINELGTLIDDLQKQGDYAVEKWTSM